MEMKNSLELQISVFSAITLVPGSDRFQLWDVAPLEGLHRLYVNTWDNDSHLFEPIEAGDGVIGYAGQVLTPIGSPPPTDIPWPPRFLDLDLASEDESDSSYATGSESDDTEGTSTGSTPDASNAGDMDMSG
jgi:hypothetical protein